MKCMKIGRVKNQLGNFIFFPIGFRILFYINMLSVINEIYYFFLHSSLITNTNDDITFNHSATHAI